MIFNPLRYVGSLIGLSILIGVVIYLAQRFVGIDGGSGTSVVALMIAAMIEGTAQYKRAGTKPEGAQMWKAAFLMTVIAFVVSTILTVAFVFATDLVLFGLYRELGTGLLLGASVFVFIIGLLVSRVGYGLGIKTQANAKI